MSDATFDLIEKAESYIEQQNIKKAISVVKKAIKQDKENASLYSICGVYYYMDDDYSNAIEMHEKALELNKDNPSTLNSLSVAYATIGKTDKAIDLVKEAINLDGENDSYWNTLGARQVEKENFEDAIKSYKKSLELNKDNVEIMGTLGFLYFNTEKKENIEKAIPLLEKAVGIEAESKGKRFYLKYKKAVDGAKYAYWNTLGDCNYELGHMKEAFFAYTNAVKTMEIAIESSPIIKELIETDRQDQDLYEQINKVINALDTEHDDLPQNFDIRKPEIWNTIAYTYQLLELYEEAIEFCEKAIKLDNKFEKSWLNAFSIYYELENYKKAIESVEEAQKIGTILTSEDRKQYLPPYAFSLDMIGEHKKAIQLYKKAVELDNSDKESWLGLFSIYYKLDNYKGAVLVFDKVKELGINLSAEEKNEYLLPYAFGLDMIGEYQKAIQYYKQAQKHGHKDNSTLAHNLKDAQKSLDEKDELPDDSNSVSWELFKEINDAEELERAGKNSIKWEDLDKEKPKLSDKD